MRVTIDMEIETEDYGGKEFKKEVEKLIKDIDLNCSLIRFKMCGKFGGWDTGRDIDWSKE